MPDHEADEVNIPIPEPWGLPLIGNVAEFDDPEHPLRTIQRLADTYGKWLKSK